MTYCSDEKKKHPNVHFAPHLTLVLLQEINLYNDCKEYLLGSTVKMIEEHKGGKDDLIFFTKVVQKLDGC